MYDGVCELEELREIDAVLDSERDLLGIGVDEREGAGCRVLEGVSEGDAVGSGDT